MNSSLKRFLFTALLRAGEKYNKKRGNFKDAIWSNEYLEDTKYAVNRFLDGYTRFRGRGPATYEGWWNTFYIGNAEDKWDAPEPLTESQINRLLVKP